MNSITILGLTAGAFTTLAFLPQVIKTWRSRSAGDLSLLMFVVFSAGVVLWLAYGLLVGELPLIVANIVTLALIATLLFFKLRYR
jgi:MtN3 and saliva related transmembrane protein